MNMKLSSDIKRLKDIIRAKKTRTAFDERQEKRFGRYILSEPLNNLSLALIKFRSALLSGSEGLAERLIEVRSAAAELPDRYSALGQLISAVCDRAEGLLAANNAEQACALIDAVHALPEIAGAPKASLGEYKICFVRPYEKRFGDNFFDGFNLRELIS